jgi:hypothetical protein
MQIDPTPTDPSPPHLEDDAPGLFTPAAELAAALVEADDLAERVNQDELERAQARAHAAAREQHDALRRAASAVWQGAWSSGAVAVLGGAGGVAGALAGNTCQAAKEGIERAGKALEGLAGPVRDILGTATQKHHEADAARSGEATSDAQFDAEQQARRAQRAEQATEQALDFARSMQDQAAQTWQAILSRF